MQIPAAPPPRPLQRGAHGLRASARRWEMLSQPLPSGRTRPAPDASPLPAQRQLSGHPHHGRPEAGQAGPAGSPPYSVRWVCPSREQHMPTVSSGQGRAVILLAVLNSVNQYIT